MQLVADAAQALGTTRTTDTVHAALAEVVNRRRRLGLFDVATDLNLAGLNELRAHRFAERRAPYGSDAGARSAPDDAPGPRRGRCR